MYEVCDSAASSLCVEWVAKDRRAVLRVLGRVAAHRVAIAVHRVEARVAVPRLVEMNAVDALRQPRLARRRRCSTSRRTCSW